MSAFVLFLVGAGVGSTALWLFQTWRTTTDEPARAHEGRDTEGWSVASIAARIEEERNTPRHRHRAHVGNPPAGVRSATAWSTTVSVG